MTYRQNYSHIDWSKDMTAVRKVQRASARSRLPCPQIMGDAMAPVESMLDGKFYDSKSALRATYRQAGVNEVGNDPSRFRTRQRRKVDRKQVKTTLEKAAARFNRGERVNRNLIASE